jgi:hypothetical protein
MTSLHIFAFLSSKDFGFYVMMPKEYTDHIKNAEMKVALTLDRLFTYLLIYCGKLV